MVPLGSLSCMVCIMVLLSDLVSDGKELSRLEKKFKINDKSNGWHIFQIVRTFILVNISWFFDRADTIPQALTMMKNAVTVWKPVQFGYS